MLRTEKWLSMEALTSVDHNFPAYNEKSKAGVFYARNWALTLDKPAAQAFEEIYGQSMAEIRKRLEQCIRGDRFYVAR